MEFHSGNYYIFKKFFHRNSHGSFYHGRIQKDMWELDTTPKAVALGQRCWWKFPAYLAHTNCQKGCQMWIYLSSFSNSTKCSCTGELLTIFAIFTVWIVIDTDIRRLVWLFDICKMLKAERYSLFLHLYNVFHSGLQILLFIGYI